MFESTHLSSNEQIHEELRRRAAIRKVEDLQLASFTEHARLDAAEAYQNYFDYTTDLNRRFSYREDLERIDFAEFESWWQRGSPALALFAEALWKTGSMVEAYPIFSRYLRLVGWGEIELDLKSYVQYEALKLNIMEESKFYGLEHTFEFYFEPYSKFINPVYLGWSKCTEEDIAVARLANWARGYGANSTRALQGARRAKESLRRRERVKQTGLHQRTDDAGNDDTDLST